MATIRASCSTCGDVELTTADVQVRVCMDDDSAAYSFRCPICTMTQVKPADERTVDLLMAAGVTYITWNLPAELQEHPSGAPINHDDLLDFHDLLERDDWYTELTASMDGRAKS